MVYSAFSTGKQVNATPGVLDGEFKVIKERIGAPFHLAISCRARGKGILPIIPNLKNTAGSWALNRLFGVFHLLKNQPINQI